MSKKREPQGKLIEDRDEQRTYLKDNGETETWRPNKEGEFVYVMSSDEEPEDK